MLRSGSLVVAGLFCEVIRHASWYSNSTIVVARREGIKKTAGRITCQSRAHSVAGLSEPVGCRVDEGAIARSHKQRDGEVDSSVGSMGRPAKRSEVQPRPE